MKEGVIMNGGFDLTDFLDTIARILIRCFVISVIILIISFLVYLFARDPLYSVYASWFPIAEEQFHLLMIGGMGIWKIIILLFYLIPYVAIRLVLGREESL
jgi:hypothetical protein